MLQEEEQLANKQRRAILKEAEAAERAAAAACDAHSAVKLQLFEAQQTLSKLLERVSRKRSSASVEMGRKNEASVLLPAGEAALRNQTAPPVFETIKSMTPSYIS